ncbi:MAG: hypothetical protein NWE88_08150 [Candidatus Bathyarchaeota archaeon]|nr:hypothetical protein [Candidatus Bathyarchaeota archaeon]
MFPHLLEVGDALLDAVRGFVHDPLAGGEDVLSELVHEDVESLVFGDAPELLLGLTRPAGLGGLQT